MEREFVMSSNLDSVGYDPDASVLEIAFASGSVYQYSGVPRPIYLGLMSAASKGSYHHDYIRDCFPCRKVG
jgi:hypothetical protein